MQKFTGGGGLAVAALLAFPGITLAHDVIFQAHATGVVGTVKVATLTKSVLINDNSLSCKGLPNEQITSDVQHAKPIYVRAKTIDTYTLGVHDNSDAFAKTEDLLLDLPGLKVTAEAISSFAHAECDPATLKPSVDGGVTILNVNVQGSPITVTGEPNQTIAVGDIAKIVFNERVVWKSEFKTNAMHVYLFNASYPAYGDVIVGYSRAKITCSAGS
jgi:hypothetical protein